MTIESSWIYPLKMVIFHSYVSLPEGKHFSSFMSFQGSSYVIICHHFLVKSRSILASQFSGFPLVAGERQGLPEADEAERLEHVD